MNKAKRFEIVEPGLLADGNPGTGAPGGPDERTRAAQRVRLARFGMAAATYGAVTLAAPLIIRIGFGSLSLARWIAFVGIALGINLVFFALFRWDLNLRFRDPSLTAAQIVVASFWGLLPLTWLPRARPLILIFFLIAFSFGMLKLRRREYFVVAAIVQSSYGALLLFEYWTRRPGLEIEYQVLLWVAYGLVLTWFAFFGELVSRLRVRLREKSGALEQIAAELRLEIATRVRTQEENEQLIDELRRTLDRVRKLDGLLPICAACKKIRDDKGYWNQIEAYISSHSEAEFSHGICPECTRKFAPELEL